MTPWSVDAQGYPTAPRNLTAEVVEGEGVLLSWGAPSEDGESVTGYQILRQLPLRGDSGLSVYVADTGSTATTYMDDDGTVAGEQYSYRVKALRGDHESHASNLAGVTIPQADPPEDDTPLWTEQQLSPQGLVAEPGAGFVQLRWDAPLGDAESVTGYEVLRSRRNRGESVLTTLVADTGDTGTSFVDSTAGDQGVYYEYRVRARRGADVSGESNLAAAVGKAPATTPGPTRLQSYGVSQVASENIVLNFLGTNPLHVSQMEVVGIHMTADRVYIGANGGGLSAIWKFRRGATWPEHMLSLDFVPRGLTASSAHLYVLDPEGTAHAYDLETLNPSSSNDITFALRGTDNPTASLLSVHALAAHAPGFTGPDSGMGLVYAAQRLAGGLEDWEIAGPPGVGVHPDELDRVGIIELGETDLATDLSTFLFVENGTGDGAHVFEVRPSGSAELSGRPELDFGRTGHDGLYYDGSLLWTLDIDSHTWNVGQTLTLRAFDPAKRIDRPDPLPETQLEGTCGIEGLFQVEGSAGPDGLLLPDLVSCPPEYSVADVVEAPDGTELYALRFAGYVTNLGIGPLDLKGNPQLADKADRTSHDVWQRALTEEGDWVNMTKPPIMFQRADGHNHFHLMGIVDFSLWDTSGTVEVGHGAKVGFCLVDTQERPDLHPNPGPQRYASSDPENGFCQAGRPGATTLRMGISPGWQDIYAWDLALQWIDVSDVRPGYYRIGQRADPDDIVVESDETNNGLALSHNWHVIPGYVAKPATIGVERGAATTFALGADAYFVDGRYEFATTRAHRIVTQPSHGSLEVGGATTVDIGGVTHKAFTGEWVTYTPDPGYSGVDWFTFVAIDLARPKYPISPTVATVTLDVSGLSATVGIENAPAWIANGSSFDFDATVNGVSSDVTWSVDGVEGGSTEAGVIDADGRYTAPAVPPLAGTVVVRAASTQSPASYAEVEVAIVVPAPATGAPAIEGIVEVGRTITANTSEIGDLNGIDKATYSYQWVRNDGNADTDIPQATSPQYILASADQGKAVAVRVSFTDDVGFAETVTSSYTAAVGALSNQPASGAPIIQGVGSDGTYLYLSLSSISDVDGLANVVYSYQWVHNDGVADADIPGAASSTYTVRRADHGKTIAVRVSFDDDLGFSESLTSEHTSVVSFAQSSSRPNFAPTGAPIIRGLPLVGETLRVDASSIADLNHVVPASFSYQWLAHDGSAYVVIPGATSDRYLLTIDELGKPIAVRVSFSDLWQFTGNLTSEPTDAVRVPPEVIPAAATVNRDSLVLEYGQALDETVTLPVSAFAVTVDGSDRPVAGASVNGSAVTLLLATQVQAGQVVLVSYTRPAGQDYVRNILEHPGQSFSDREVENRTRLPRPPQGLTATPNDDYTVTLDWYTPGDRTITGYQVLRHVTGVDSPGAFSTLVDDTGNRTTRFLDEDTTASTGYVYAVRAHSPSGTSQRSANAAVVTMAPLLLGVSDGSATEGLEVEFNVVLSRPTARDVTVQYSTSDGTATEDPNNADGRDYTPASAQTLRFSPGETMKAVRIPTGDDTVEEEDETFTLTLSSPSQNAGLGPDPSATGTIMDDDRAEVRDATIKDLTLTDPHGATIVLTPFFDPLKSDYEVTLSGGMASMTVSATKSYGGATLEFIDNAGAVETGNTSVAEYSLVLGDNLIEIEVTSAIGNEVRLYTVIVTVPVSTDATLNSLELRHAKGGAIDLTPSFDPSITEYTASVSYRDVSVRLTAVNNHPGASVVVISPDGKSAPDSKNAKLSLGDNLLQAVVTAEDGNTEGVYSVSVERAEPDPGVSTTLLSNFEVQGAWSTPHPFNAGQDWLASSVLQSFTTGILDATVEAVTLHFDRLSGSEISVAIHEDDGGQLGDLLGTLVPPERLSKFSTFTADSNSPIRLSAGTGYFLKVDRVSGDYQIYAVNANGEDAGSSPGWTLANTALKWDEALLDYVFDYVGRSLRIVITGYEGSPPPPTLSLSDGTATEGSDVDFTITLINAAAYAVTVRYDTSDGTATSDPNAADGPDYTPAPGQTLTFAPSETVKAIGIPTGDDRVDEDDETFTLTLTSPSQNAELGPNSSATGTIVDDDTAGVSVSETALHIPEGLSAVYTVALDSLPAGDVAVTVGGVSDTDLSVDRATLTFTTANWYTAQTVKATAAQDEDAVNDTATLTHAVDSTDDDDYDGIPVPSVRVTITDDDVAAHADATIRQLTLTDPDGSSIVLTPSFDPLVDTYEASAPSGVTTIGVAATKSYGGATVEFIGKAGAVQTGDTSEVDYNLDVGDSLIEVEVTSASGAVVKTYRVTVTREASNDATLWLVILNDANGNSIELTPNFDPAITEYYASVTNGVDSVRLAAAKNHPGASFLVLTPSGKAEPYGSVADLAVGVNLLGVVVTAEDGAEVNTYTVTVTRAGSTAPSAASDDATLSSLELHDANGAKIELTPNFDPSTAEYSVSVAHDMDSATLAAAKNHPGATVAVFSTSGPGESDQATFDLTVGRNPIRVVVTAEDGTTTMVYGVSVTRPAPPVWSATLTVGTDETVAPVATGYSRWAMHGFRASPPTSSPTMGLSYEVVQYLF